MSRYIICWKSLLTEYRGQGTLAVTGEMADAIIKDQNEKWENEIVHWKKAQP